jgi:serine/threonine-protein kinase
LLADPAVPAVAGELMAAEDHWRLSNFSVDRSLLVENPEGAGEFFKVSPRRLAAPVPFEFARVVLPTQGRPIAFQVFAPQHRFADREALGSLHGGTVAAYSLDVASTYFLVLVALCEPRLRDRSTAAIPTTPAVVQRLRHDPRHRDITAKAVSFHIDYLTDTKLRIRQAGEERLDSKRETLVSVALRFGLVTEEHVAMLPPPHRMEAPR